AAALDLIFEFVESGFTRQSTVALLRSPHFVFEWDGQRVDRDSVSALDAVLSSRRYLGGLERMFELVTAIDASPSAAAGPALRVAHAAATALAPLSTTAPASVQFQC